MDNPNIIIEKVDEKNYIVKRLNSLAIKINSNITVQDLYNSLKTGQNLDNSIRLFLFNKNPAIYSKFSNILAVLFQEPIKVIYYNALYQEKFVTLTQNNIYSTLEIDEVLKQFKVKKLILYILLKMETKNKQIILNQKQFYQRCQV